MNFNIIKTILDNYWKFVDHKRKLRFTVHRAFHLSSKIECFYLNVTNLSSVKEIEITHLFFINENKQIPIIQPDRPLPKRLKPDETWETWIRVSQIPSKIVDKPYRKARVRLSTGKVIKSRFNRGVPHFGEIPGGKVTQV
jgi:hypothetical protein